MLIAVYNLGANVGLFIPFELYFHYIKTTPALTHLLLIAIGSITAIEGMQFITERGSLDVDDLFLNVLGVSIGYFFSPISEGVPHRMIKELKRSSLPVLIVIVSDKIKKIAVF